MSIASDLINIIEVKTYNALDLQQFFLEFTFGNIVGMYLAQNHNIPNLAKKLEEMKKDLNAKKKLPSS
ncbi:PREDICTED: uncharacterized protein C7orf73-like [Chrysochloris asiatica]|uniref:Uncharacterized protein C7orf73-like n=1 Tax=Chrysochloris asiatica TaxID=185453 RepID=A0A9B0TM17_CHRAS|nr:PREDICTED: uncharacterized protein C7orf73-like [Chrysochloris asiatica]